MPVTPQATRRRSNTRRDEIKQEERRLKPRPQSTCEPSSVQDRIRQWQTQGAADAASPDSLSVRSLPLSDVVSEAPRAQTPRARTPEKKAPSSTPTWRQRFIEKERELRAEEKQTKVARDILAPKKRVISDSQWKAKKDNKTESSPHSAQRPKVPTPHHDLTYTSTNTYDDREARRAGRRRARKSRDSEAIPVSSSVQDLNSYIDQELARHLESPGYQDPSSDRASQHSSLLDEDRGTATVRSKYAETLGRSSKDDSPATDPRSRPKGARIFSKTKEIFNKPEDPPLMSNRLPSIEAWLEEQPDPFIEPERNETAQPVEVPEPLRRRSRKSRRTSGHDIVVPNKTWDSVTVHEDAVEAESYSAENQRTSERRGDHRRTVRDNPSPEASPTGLKRRGARTQRKPRPPEHRSPGAQEQQPSTLPLRPSRNAERPQRLRPPSSGHRLETIASVETFNEKQEPPGYEDHLSAEPCGLKRKLTTHEDLMSVLSLPVHRKSTRSRRRPQQTPAAEVLQALVAEEEKYSRELKTLVDGVIPVLLQCVLSKANSVAAAGLFTPTGDSRDDTAFTKPIIDMGIALERLKSLHARTPLTNVDSLLAWGQNAQKAYNDYLNAWRLGFQDVVVNLAPLKEGENLDSGMSRDAEGDIINAEGKKVDVAYLLKRPLVRVKNLAKTFSAIQEQTNTKLAVDVAQLFDQLTATARRRHQEEQARLEDEAAAAVDATRARNIRTLGSNPNVTVDRSGKVRARDCFDLTMYHSTGQRMDCRLEMIFRDNQAGQATAGDVLICGIDESGKWLLFSPVAVSSISARRGEDDFDLVVMIRGPSGIGQEWQELLALKSDDQEATTEWLSMLGSNPLPPKLNRTSSFKTAPSGTSGQQVATLSAPDADKPLPSIDEVDILPMGEPSVLGKSDRSSPRSRPQKPLFEKLIPRLNLGGALQSKQSPPLRPSKERTPPRHAVPSLHSSDRSTISDFSLRDLPTTPKASSAPATAAKEIKHSRDTPQKYCPQHAEDHMMSGALGVDELMDNQQRNDPGSQTSTPKRNENAANRDSVDTPKSVERPVHKRATSSTPSQELPTIAKLRPAATYDQPPTNIPLNESIRDQWTSLSGIGNSGERRRHRTRKARSEIFTEDIPSPPAHTHNRGTPHQAALLRSGHPGDVPRPTPPTHKSKHQSLPANVSGQELQLSKPSPKSEKAKKRRSSSPLKREYAPSTASKSSSDSDSDDISDSSSDTSQDFMSEVKDMHTPLVAVTAGNRRSSRPLQNAPAPAPRTTGARTLAPSDSASQGPYRNVPASSKIAEKNKKRTIAIICAWSEKGAWEPVHPDECSVVISPGLIEAFEMTAAHSRARRLFAPPDSEDGDSRASSITQKPLVAFELTPNVTLRRGTALDIFIRSPSTANSKLKTTSYIMFRSRNADECDTLYGMINWARCNNPTYIQLEAARPRQPSVTFNVGESDRSRSKSGSWFSFGGSEKKSSYRASSAPGGMSVGGDSEASVGTVGSAILKRLGVSSAFNLNRSSVMRKSGLSRPSGSLYSESTGRSGSRSSPLASQLGFVPGKDGPNVPLTSAEAVGGGGMVNNMKIRLYVRKGQGWENLGAGRLSVLPAPDSLPPGVGVDSAPSTETSTPTRPPSAEASGQQRSKGPRLSSSKFTPHRKHGNGQEKRIVVRKNKDGDVVLLDEVLGEACFERVMQTGIAVKVWHEDNEVAHRGGVLMGQGKVYMMQFPGTREAGWVFGLCGTYRYSE